MDWGILATTLGGIIAAWLTYRGVASKNAADSTATRTAQLLEALQAQVDRHEARITTLEEERDAARAERDDARAEAAVLRVERDELRGRIRDQAEMLDDWRTIGDWLVDGARPPAPTLSWRLIQERADHERAHARQRDTSPTPTSQED